MMTKPKHTAEHVPPAELSSMLFRVKKALRRGE
ncbi:hypothetical protein DA89_16 [Vibrio cholerae]|nr:hypothetical protein DA89_16 [Vibrio cholerae]